MIKERDQYLIQINQYKVNIDDWRNKFGDMERRFKDLSIQFGNLQNERDGLLKDLETSKMNSGKSTTQLNIFINKFETLQRDYDALNERYR